MAGVSLKKIAEAAQVSLSTASMILNDRATYCSAATRKRVKDAAEKLGYRTNFGYRLMQKQRTDTVAILCSADQLNEPHITQLMVKIVHTLENRGYTCYCGRFSNHAEENLEQVKRLINRGTEHFLMLGCPVGDGEIIAELKRYGIPAMGAHFTGRTITSGTALGFRCLLSYVRSRVGDNFKLVCNQTVDARNSSRIQGVASFYPDMSIDEIEDKFLWREAESAVPSEWRNRTAATGYHATRKLLAARPDIGAIMFFNDTRAVGGGDYILNSGNPAWKKIILTGSNNEFVSDHYPLAISSLQFDLDRHAALFAENLNSPEPYDVSAPSWLHLRLPRSGTYPGWVEKTFLCSEELVSADWDKLLDQ